MPPKKRKRSSKRQTLDQQTITQTDPFRPQIQPEEDLEEIGDEYAEGTPKTHEKQKRKRRKTTSGTPLARTIQTRSAKKQAELDIKAAVESPTVTHESNKENSHQGPTPASLDHATVQMPPPKTPKTTRRKEIPSSQSPAETPYSAQPLTRVLALAASPLKERSTNVHSCKPSSSPNKIARRRPRLEVADSTGLEKENVEISIPLISRYNTIEGAPALSFPPRSTKIPKSSLPSKPSDRNRNVDGDTKLSLLSDTGRQGPPTLRRQGTIADSEEGDISPIGRSPERPSDLQAEGLLSQHESALELGIVERSNSSTTATSSVVRPPQTPQSTTPEDPSFETVPTQPLFQQSILKHSSPVQIHSNPPPREQSQNQFPDSEEPSLLSTVETPHPNSPPPPPQPPPLETESQFENAWRDYTPPPTPLLYENEDSQPIDLGTPQCIHPAMPQHPSPLRFNHSNSIDDPITLPPPNPFSLSPRNENDPMKLPPVPPSQATTTDEVTQSSPRRMHQPSSPPAERISLLSSSPHHPLLSRRAPNTRASYREEEEEEEYEGWNGVRMTDSQLLPASLLDDEGGFGGVDEELELLREEEVVEF
ncbi:MAG: hypothetical protein LQ350_005989 [Teloschistes chrysophthalmus]|nr:MAG: hypothetical protein LQ350_005989 [Niorma chrysophthalma]